MKKKIAILAVLFLAGYFAAHFWIRAKNRITDDATKLGRLVECDPNQVREMEISGRRANADYKADFRRVDEAAAGTPSAAQLAASRWRMGRPESGEADASLLSRLATMVCELYDPLPARPEEWKADEADGVALEFRLAGAKESYRMHFGGMGADRLNVVRFRNPAGAERTIRIPPKLFQLVSLEPRTFLNLRVMRAAADNVQAVALKVDGKERFRLEREGAGWVVLQGAKTLGAGSEEAVKFVNRLSTLRALSVAKQDFTPENCSALKHKFTVELRGVAGRSETLRFQPEGKRGTLRACNSERDALFIVHQDLNRYIDVSAAALLKR